MPSTHHRVQSATGTVALVLALLALVASAAGAGYAAGQIGTNGIKNNAITAKKIKNNAVTTKKIKKNAVTSAKVKDGSLTAADMVPNEVERLATFGNGGDGDCVWQSGAVLIPGGSGPTFRKDRFGTIHLAGMAIGSDGVGGDADCDPTDPGEAADAVMFMLPAGYIPAKTLFIISSGGAVIIAGQQGLSSLGFVLPPGGVASPVGSSTPVTLDGISFEPVGSSAVLPKMSVGGRVSPELLHRLGLD
jgi:hypothetical protein